MKTKSFIIPQYITAKEIRDFRKSLGLSQKEFADFAEQVDKSKVVIQKHLEKAQLLFDSLMQEYFG